MSEEEKIGLISRFLDWLHNEHELVVAKQTEEGWKKARDIGLYPSRLVDEFLETENG